MITFFAFWDGQHARSQERFKQTHAAMGTVFTLELYASDQQSAERLAQEAFDCIDRVDEELSNYKPSSELSRISRDAGKSVVTTDPETFEFLQRSVEWSLESRGAFDITIGPVMQTWGFFFHSGRVPSEQELLALRKRVGWQKIRLDPQLRTVRFLTNAPMELDPGSIGKGFAVDLAVRTLRAEGVTSALLSAGGSTIYAIGAPLGEAGWPVVVPDPRSGDKLRQTVMLKDESLSTGACTEKFFIRDGHRYCHIIDPKTLRPVEGMLQTTVIDPSATDSDALSTVAFVQNSTATRNLFTARSNTRLLLFNNAAGSQGCLAVHWLGNPCRTTNKAR